MLKLAWGVLMTIFLDAWPPFSEYYMVNLLTKNNLLSWRILLVLRLSWIFFLLPDLQDQSRLQRWVKRGPRGVSPKFPKVREAIAGILEGMGWQVGFLQEFSVIMIVIWKVIIISKVEDQQFTAISPFGDEVRLPFFRNVVKGEAQKNKNCHNNSAISL